jgi:hypothetical protein
MAGERNWSTVFSHAEMDHGSSYKSPANIPDRTVSSGTTCSADATTGSLDRVGRGSRTMFAHGQTAMMIACATFDF